MTEFFVYRVDFEMDHHKIKILVEDGTWTALDDFLMGFDAKLVHIVADNGTYFAILEKIIRFNYKSTFPDAIKADFPSFVEVNNPPVTIRHR